MTERTGREHTVDRGPEAWLVELTVADPPVTWAAAGFTVDGDRVLIGSTTIRLIGPPSGDRRRGISGWSLAGLAVATGTDGDIDGLPTSFVARPNAKPPQTEPRIQSEHANGVTGIDHVVVQTPDLERTVVALEAVGLTCRRIRDTTSYDGSPMRQAFFRLGPTILEVVGAGEAGTGEAASDRPATWFGIALDVADLDHTGVVLGDALGPVKRAVQAGRRIATLRSQALDLSVAVAVMDDHGDR